MNTFQKTSLRATVIAATIAAMPFSAQAAGLGRISVLSALGQPLRAEIELNATADEAKSMTAAVAAPDAFKAAKLSYAPALTSVRMAVEQRGGKSYVRLTSVKPVNDPFVSLLVELNWQSGRLLREYTFLLDPPSMPAPKASADVAAAPVVKPQATGARSIGAQAGGTYNVRRGDTLGKIAAQYLPQGVAVDQMLVALYRANPEAFVGNNVNRLRSGVILNVPDAADVSAIPRAEARREIVAHAADFADYRRRVAARVAETAAAPEAEPTSQSSSGKITAKVEEPALPSAASKDQVKVSRTVDEAKPAATDNGAAMAAASERLKSLEEDLVARDKALREATDRLAALEANIAELQKLIALKNENLAALQTQASTAPAAAPMVESAAPASAPKPEASAPVAEPKTETPPASAAEQDAIDKELKALVAPEPASEQAAAPAVEPAPPVEAPAPVVAEPAPPPAPAPAPMAPPPAEPSFLDSLIANPTTLYGGGGILALLLGYGLLRSRKNRAASPEATAMASVFPPDQNSVFGETGGQSVDTGSSSLIQTDFSQSGLSAIDADEGVDPVAEADVYMAYGRDAQAEEILLDALKSDPNRSAVHVKLLEIYGQRKNMKQFETTATELYSVTGGNGPDWAKAVEMGRKLDPENPLFLRGPQSEIDLPLGEEIPEDAGFKAADDVVDDNAAFSAPAAKAPAEEAPSDIDAAIDGDESAEMSLDFPSSVPNPDEPSPSQLKDTWAIPGDLNQYTDSDLEAAAVAQIEDEVTPDAADVSSTPDSGDLDFNLDLDEVDAVPAADTASMEATEVAGRRVNESFTTTDTGLEFNLDLAETDEAADASLDVTRVDGVSPDSAADIGHASDLDFDAEITLPEVDTEDEVDDAAAVEAEAEPDAEAEPPKEDDAKRSAEAAAGVSVVDLEKTNFDGSLLDFDFDLDEGQPGGGDDDRMMATSLDLSDISLDLEGADEEAKPAESAPETPASEAIGAADEALDIDVGDALDDEAPVFDEPAPAAAEADEKSQEDDMMASLSKSVVTSLTDSRSMPDLPDDEDLNQEVDTKLELARAYEEMGDAEGARELLDEVIRDGNEAQQEQARAVFARLG